MMENLPLTRIKCFITCPVNCVQARGKKQSKSGLISESHGESLRQEIEIEGQANLMIHLQFQNKKDGH